MAATIPGKPPHAPWYVVTFHYQMALLASALAAVCLYLLPQNVPPVALPRWMRGVFVAVPLVAIPAFSWFAVRVFLDGRWLHRGHGKPRQPILGPPSRVNCCFLGFMGVALIAMGVEDAIIAQRPVSLSIIFTLCGLFTLSFCVSGYLWKYDVIRGGQ